MTNENTLARLCVERGKRQSASRWSKYTALNSLTVQLQHGIGTVAYLPPGIDAVDWAKSVQIDHDNAMLSPALNAGIATFIKPQGDGRATITLKMGNGLVASYHPWREIGDDGNSGWLRACLMCPELDVIHDYPALAARAVLWHMHVARECELLTASVTLHIPRLLLMRHDIAHTHSGQAVHLKFTPLGRLYPVEGP